MENEDYISLISLVKTQMAEVGFAELASDENFTKQLIEGDFIEERLPSPKDHLIELLIAFKTQVKLEHKGTISSSLSRIGQFVDSEKPQKAIYVQSPREGSEEEIAYDLSEQAQDHTEILSQLGKLIAQLSEAEAGRLD